MRITISQFILRKVKKVERAKLINYSFAVIFLLIQCLKNLCQRLLLIKIVKIYFENS